VVTTAKYPIQALDPCWVKCVLRL